MGKIFDLDNPVWRAVGMLADFFILTVLWAVCSLPIITIGASTTALYYVALKMAEERGSSVVRMFFKSFKDNFLQATGLWIIMAVAGAVIAYVIYICSQLDNQLAVVYFWVFVILAILYLFMLVVIFALEARVIATMGNMLLMTFMVCIKNFSWVLFMVVMLACIIALGVFVFAPILMIAIGGIAYLHAKVYCKIIFPKYNWNLDDATEN